MLKVEVLDNVIEMNKFLLQKLRNNISHLSDGKKINYLTDSETINLILFIEHEGLKASSDMILYLWNNIKDMNVETGYVINDIPITIVVNSRKFQM